MSSFVAVASSFMMAGAIDSSRATFFSWLRELSIGSKTLLRISPCGLSFMAPRVERSNHSLCTRFQEFELVRASGNAPDPGTHLVRLRL